MADVGGPFPSGHGPVERAGMLNFVDARANLARVNSPPSTESENFVLDSTALATKAHSFAKSAKQIIQFDPIIVP